MEQQTQVFEAYQKLLTIRAEICKTTRAFLMGGAEKAELAALVTAETIAFGEWMSATREAAE